MILWYWVFKGYWVVMVVWCVAAVICVPPLLGWKDATHGNYKYDPINHVHACVLFQTRSYVIYSASGSFFVPLVVTLFFYAKIFVVIHGRVRKNRAKAAASSKSATSMTAQPSCSGIKPSQPELSMGWVDPLVGFGRVEIFQFLVGYVGSTIAKVLKI